MLARSESAALVHAAFKSLPRAIIVGGASAPRRLPRPSRRKADPEAQLAQGGLGLIMIIIMLVY